MFEKLAMKAKAHPLATKIILGVGGLLVAAGITAVVIGVLNQDDENVVDGQLVEEVPFETTA